jgi:multicomponent Na+:H+ antiporter subunit F
MSAEVLAAGALLLTLFGPVYRMACGPTIFDRMVGVGATGTTTVILVCLLGRVAGRMDMFVDIAIAYAMLNFSGSLVVAKYLNASRKGTAG